ncbi:MAG: flagellar protein FlaG [Burkholderiales bacterium]|nr:flagellar protein FlaG [Burkholderiales bacterium]
MDIQSLGKTQASGSPVLEKSAAPVSSAVANQHNTTNAQTNIAVTQAAREPSVSEVSKAVSDINKAIQALSQNLEFSVDKDANKVVVKVIDQQTKQVLRQIPTVEALEIAKSLDKLQGLLIRQQA